VDRQPFHALPQRNNGPRSFPPAVGPSTIGFYRGGHPIIPPSWRCNIPPRSSGTLCHCEPSGPGVHCAGKTPGFAQILQKLGASPPEPVYRISGRQMLAVGG